MLNTDMQKSVCKLTINDGTKDADPMKVKSFLGGLAGAVVWTIHNKSGSSIRVELANFTPNSSEPPLDVTWLTPNPTDAIANNHKGSIVALAHGEEGDVYNYDVKVNGSVIADPQLEI